MNYKQQRYEQDDSLSIIFYMQTVHKSLENFRELFCLESNVKGYLRWIEGTGSKLVSRLSFTMFDTHAQRCDVVLQPVLFELRDAAT